MKRCEFSSPALKTPVEVCTKPSHLADEVRLVLGLIWMQVGLRRLLRTCGADLVRRILLSDNAVVRQCLAEGLPRGDGVELPDGEPPVRCLQCGQNCSVVPCMCCARGGDSDRSRCIADPPEPDEPTDATPGSFEKLEVMRKRKEAGRSVFHKGDRRVEQGYIRLRGNTDSLSVREMVASLRDISRHGLDEDWIRLRCD